MKKLNFRMLVAILTCGLLTTACGVIENPIEREYNQDLVDDFWEMEGNEGDSTVVAALKSIENVQDLKPFESIALGQAYYFNPPRVPSSSRWCSALSIRMPTPSSTPRATRLLEIGITTTIAWTASEHPISYGHSQKTMVRTAST